MMAPTVREVYRLTPLQEGILFHHLMAPEAGYYVDQLSVTLDFKDGTAIDRDRIEAAFKQLLVRHDVLRTGFIWEEQASPLQIVADAVELPFSWADWSRLSDQEVAEAQAALIADQRALGFNLECPPLLRVAAARLPGHSLQLLVTYHHIILDAWSVANLFAEFRTCLLGQEPAQQGATFRDYVRSLPHRQKHDAQTFWQRSLAGVTAGTPLVAGTPPASQPEYSQGLASLQLTASDSAKLVAAARSCAITLASLVHAAWARVLALRAGTADVMFGSTFAGRPADLAGSAGIVGLCINTLPLRITAAQAGVTVGSWLREVHLALAAVRGHEFTPLSKVREWSGLPSGTALFDCVLAFENIPGLADADITGDLPAARDGRYLFHTNYPINLLIVPGECLNLRINFDAARYRQSEIERCLREFASVALRLAADPDQPLAAIGLLDPADPADALPEHPAFPVEDLEPVHLTVAKHASHKPAAVAISDGDRDWTYGWLEQRSDAWAAQFATEGVAVEDRIAVHMHRSAELVAVLLGILKAGAAYVPLDPMYPAARLDRMIDVARPVLVVCDEDLAAALPSVSCPVWLAHADLPDHKPDQIVSLAQACAYVIFTSGSSGIPKGIELAHLGLANMLADWNRLFAMNHNSRLLQFASISFDASVWEMLSAVTAGGTLCIASRHTLYSAEDLLGALTTFKVTHALLPPSLLGSLDPGTLPDLSCIAAIGERCTGDIARRWSNGRRFFNAYGPAEGTITNCVYEYRPGDGHDGDPPIGWPMANVALYVLDFEGLPLPPGVPGELAIGGVNVARGYIGQPGLTAQKFPCDPFSEQGARLYLSGDRVVRHDDGALQYLGRADDQVKIRGTRIETGEVEDAIRQHSAVQDVLVMACDWAGGPEKRLVGYVVPVASQDGPSSSDLRTFLRARLAEVMIPSAFVLLDFFPVGVNGKIDRKALPEPGWQRDEGDAAYRAPSSGLEQQLVELWKRVLKLDQVGIDDNYFDLGGDSIISIRLVAAAQRSGIALSPRDIFEHQTIARLAAAKTDDMPDAASPVGPSGHVGAVAALPMQQQFIAWMGTAAAHYNQAVLLHLDDDIEQDVVAAALAEVVDRHDALRLKAECQADGSWQFSVNPPGAWDGLQCLETGADPARQYHAVQASMDPVRGRVFAALWHGAPSPQVGNKLLLVAHHLAIDAMSWSILLADLACALDDNGPAAVKAPSFATAAAALQHAVAQGALDGWKDHWERIVNEEPWGVEILAERRDAAQVETTVRISASATRALQGMLPAQGHLGDAMLAAVAMAGRGGLIDLESDGRTMPEVPQAPAAAIGWFTAIAPFQLPVPSGSLAETIRTVSQLRQQWETSSYSFAALRHAEQIPQGMPRAVLANWLGDLAGRLPADVPFRLSLESPGPERDHALPRPYPVELNGWLDGGEMILAWRHPQTPRFLAAINNVAELLEAATDQQHPAEGGSSSPGGRSKRDRLMAVLQSGAAAK